MNQLNTKQNCATIDLAVALDHTIEAANALHLNDTELITLLLEHLHPNAFNDTDDLDELNNQNVVQFKSSAPRKMFDPLAGP